VSLGEYSLQNDKWLRIPTKRRANFDQSATRLKYEKLLDIVERALDSKNLSKIQKVLKKIKQYRQAGLDKGGEFGPENLAFKALRSQGYITKLYDLRDKLHSEHLTIETMYQDPAKIAETSGYIPSNAQRNDPRFKTALTVDVKPDSIKKNAKAFSWLTTRAGIPPTAKPSGKI
jgi:hypothetical protein